MKLTEHIWTCCQAFEFRGYVFANDSKYMDGAQEYGVLHCDHYGEHLMQIESIACSCCTPERALALIRRITAEKFDRCFTALIAAERLQTPAQHGQCHLCQ